MPGGKSNQLNELIGREARLFENAFQRATFEVSAVERNGNDAGALRMTKKSMRASAVIQIKAHPVEHPNHIGGRAHGQARHGGLQIHCDALDARRTRLNGNLFAVLHEALEVATNGVFHHRAGFFNRVALGHKSRQRRHRHGESPFRGGLEYSGVLILRHVLAFFFVAEIPSLSIRSSVLKFCRHLTEPVADQTYIGLSCESRMRPLATR